MNDKLCFLAEGDDLRTESNCAKVLVHYRKRSRRQITLSGFQRVSSTPHPQIGGFGGRGSTTEVFPSERIPFMLFELFFASERVSEKGRQTHTITGL
jgi:hypothetical protein